MRMNKQTTKKIISEIIDILKATDDMDLIKHTIDELKNIYDQNKVTVKFAGELQTKEKTVLNSYIKRKFTNHTNIEFINDESLIGGYQIIFKDQIVDSSIKTKLKGLKQ